MLCHSLSLKILWVFNIQISSYLLFWHSIQTWVEELESCFWSWYYISGFTVLGPTAPLAIVMTPSRSSQTRGSCFTILCCTKLTIAWRILLGGLLQCTAAECRALLMCIHPSIVSLSPASSHSSALPDPPNCISAPDPNSTAAALRRPPKLLQLHVQAKRKAAPTSIIPVSKESFRDSKLFFPGPLSFPVEAEPSARSFTESQACTVWRRQTDR